MHAIGLILIEVGCFLETNKDIFEILIIVDAWLCILAVPALIFTLVVFYRRSVLFSDPKRARITCAQNFLKLLIDSECYFDLDLSDFNDLTPAVVHSKGTNLIWLREKLSERRPVNLELRQMHDQLLIYLEQI